MSDTIGTASTTSGGGSSSAGKCPVDHKTRSLWGVLGIGGGGSASSSSSSSQSLSSSSSSTISKDPPSSNNSSSIVPASLEEAARHAQTPQPNQRLPLSTHRLESSIPRGGSSIPSSSNGDDEKKKSNSDKTKTTNIPAHQIQLKDASSSNNNNKDDDNNNNTWVYPSEQQVFNAMKRKGWKGIEEESIPSFLQIHNSVNERSWQEVLRWEQQSATSSHANANDNATTVELSRFEGRPQDLSPKAWFLSTFLLYDKPFDRHDWYVVNKNNKNNDDNANSNNSNSNSSSSEQQQEKRYVLDFYMSNDNSENSMMPKVKIDVRPALDTPEAFVQRGKQILRELFPGISRELDEKWNNNN